MSLISKSKYHGFTLTELMVAVAINAVIFLALVTLFIMNLTRYTNAINTNRLNQQLEAAIQLMASDIRRAGYWSNAKNDIGLDQNNNPFMASGVDVSVGASNSCILFAYDKSGSGTLPAISSSSDDERYGYRLTGGAIQTRPWGASFSCTSRDWENMTDPNIITITSLTFTLNTQSISSGGTSTITLRSVDISVTGQLVGNATITKTLTQHVRIRNDKFSP